MGRIPIVVALVSSDPRGFLHGGCRRGGAVVCPEVEALGMGLWASYSTLGGPGSPRSRERSSVPGAGRQVHVSRGTRSLMERCPAQEKGPHSSVPGMVRIETRETNRWIGVGEPGFFHQAGPGLGRFWPMQGRVGCLAQRCFLPEVAEGTQE